MPSYDPDHIFNLVFVSISFGKSKSLNYCGKGIEHTRFVSAEECRCLSVFLINSDQ